MPQMEKRAAVAPAEIRAAKDTVKVSGYAAVFNETADIGDFFREVIAPGAFREAIGRDDVVFLINHEGLPLARTRSGTLKLTEDDRGLMMETRLDPGDPDVQTILPKMKRGDLDKMSFAFRVLKETWDETVKPPLRTIQAVELYDVAIVTTPAYEGTEIGLRSLSDHRALRRAENHNAAALRLRMKIKQNLADRRIGKSG